MICSKSSSMRYLEGFVIVAALVHFAAMTLAAWIASPDDAIALSHFAVLGFVPATTAFLLERKAWTTRDDISGAYSSSGPVALLAGLIASHLGRFRH